MAGVAEKKSETQNGTMPETTAATTLTASYSSPTNQSFTATQPLSAPSSNSIEEKTRYLRDLRSAAAAIQERVNQELTSRMEEDKQRDGAAADPSAGGGKGKPSADDVKEEENYGEETVEADD